MTDPLAPCGYCRRCAIHDDPGGCLEVERYVREHGIKPLFTCDRCGRQFDDGIDAGWHEIWHAQKDAGEAVAALLAPLPVGAEFKLHRVNRAYDATYRKNEDGSWDQVSAPEMPLVRNMDAAHLGFCVGLTAIVDALDAGSAR